MKVFINHIGFETTDFKKAVLYTEQCPKRLHAWVKDCETELIYPVTVTGPQQLKEWAEGYYYQADFSGIEETGAYRLIVCADGEETFSEPFETAEEAFNCRSAVITGDGPNSGCRMYAGICMVWG